MLELDIRTLIVVATFVSIGSAAALILFWRSESRPNGAGFWAIGMSCLTIGGLLMFSRGSIPDFISIVVANTLYILGFLLILRGIRIFAGRPSLVFLDYFLLPTTAVLFYYFNYIDENINFRIIIASSTFVIICVTVVVTLLSEKNASWRHAGFAVATVFSLFGISHIIRVGIVLHTPFEYDDLMHTNVSSSLIFLGDIFIRGGTAITLILMSNSTLESKLKIASFVVNQSASSIIMTDTTGTIQYVNPAFTEKTGYLPEDVIGKKTRILGSGERPIEESTAIWQALSTGNSWRGEFHNRKKDGELFWEIGSIAPVKKRNGNITHYVAIKEDITELKHAEQRIRHMANHDVLTGLPTRRLLKDRLEIALVNAKRSETKVAILFIDLDGFKTVNDTLGHIVGDSVLKETADRLCFCVRETDTVSRVGGDEFCILLTNIKDKNNITIITDKLIKAVAAPFKYESGNINIGASIGIALYPDNGFSSQKLISLADKAMYQIKRQGKNHYAFSEVIRQRD